eukprot:m.114310 g.114310  ORF g.114310 m.114310 type:complete len:90 (+) comp37484_c0_seq3:486-755(+)
MSVTCEPVSGRVNQTGDSFQVHYSGNGLMTSTSRSQLPIKLSMLVENTSYEIVVEALNSEGQFENSTSVNYKDESSRASCSSSSLERER